MGAGRDMNRAMFWRIVRRLISANPGRLFVILLALGAGAAVTAALLNLQVDAKRRLSTEFRAFGANSILSPKAPAEYSEPLTISENLLSSLPPQTDGKSVARTAFLYAQANFGAFSDIGTDSSRVGSGTAVIAGYSSAGGQLNGVFRYKVIDGKDTVSTAGYSCQVGQRVASQFQIRAGTEIKFKVGNKADSCVVSQVWEFGGPEDSQIFMDLKAVQQITNRPRQVSLVQMSVPGPPEQIDQYLSSLQKQFPEVDVRPIRQFTEGEAKIYSKISGLLTATVAIVLLLTGLCVMAAMTNVAMERRNDVGLMKAIGGSVRRVLRLFLVEAALLGFAGGAIGAAAGIFISVGLGKAVFGLAAQPRLIVYPVSVALTMLVAILSAYPLRRLASIKPASVFRGEA